MSLTITFTDEELDTVLDGLAVLVLRGRRDAVRAVIAAHPDLSFDRPEPAPEEDR